MKTAVIIAHHTGTLINRCLDSLDNLNIDKFVITTDHSLYNDKARIIRIKSDLNKPTFKRNLGAYLSHSEYLCFLDDDIEVTKDCIQNMEKYLNDNPHVGMVYALLYKMDNHEVVDTAGSYLSWCGLLYETYDPPKNPVKVMSAKSACCMIRSKLFNHLGGFDQDFVIYGEETDLSWRVWNEGYQVVLLPHAVAYHAFETPLKPSQYYTKRFIHYHGSKNYVTMLLKNLPSNRLYMAGITFLLWFIIACSMLFKNRKASRYIFLGLFYNIKHFMEIWKKKQYQRMTRKSEYMDYWKDVYKNPPLKYYIGRFRDYLFHQLHG